MQFSKVQKVVSLAIIKGDLFAHFHLVFVSTSIINTLQHIFKSSVFSVKEQS